MLFVFFNNAIEFLKPHQSLKTMWPQPALPSHALCLHSHNLSAQGPCSLPSLKH